MEGLIMAKALVAYFSASGVTIITEKQKNLN